MATNSKRPALSGEGLLTPDYCVLAMIDLQPQMLFHVANFDRHLDIMLAKAARFFEAPVVLSTVRQGRRLRIGMRGRLGS